VVAGPGVFVVDPVAGLVGLVVGLAVGLAVGLDSSVVVGLAAGPAAGLVGLVVATADLVVDLVAGLDSLVVDLVVGPVVGLVGLVVGLAAGPDDFAVDLVAGLAVGRDDPDPAGRGSCGSLLGADVAVLPAECSDRCFVFVAGGKYHGCKCCGLPGTDIFRVLGNSFLQSVLEVALIGPELVV
jgi:hypothetical protein